MNLDVVKAFLWCLSAALWVAAWADDAITLRRVEDSTYSTPWFSTNWLRQPFTNARLAGHPTREYWTRNAIGSERWLVREVDLDGRTFWTTLKRVPVGVGDAEADAR